MQLKNRC